MQRLIHGRWNRKLIEFHKKIVFLVDAKGRGVFLKLLKILRIQVKIAARRDRQASVQPALQFIPRRPHLFVIELIFGARVRRRNHTGDSVLDGVFRHRQ